MNDKFKQKKEAWIKEHEEKLREIGRECCDHHFCIYDDMDVLDNILEMFNDKTNYLDTFVVRFHCIHCGCEENKILKKGWNNG